MRRILRYWTQDSPLGPEIAGILTAVSFILFAIFIAPICCWVAMHWLSWWFDLWMKP